jgi:hypothetical protein
MRGPAAGRTVQDEAPELPLEVGLHLEELLTQHLRLERDRVGASEPGGGAAPLVPSWGIREASTTFAAALSSLCLRASAVRLVFSRPTVRIRSR